jgi:hypothetical protein
MMEYCIFLATLDQHYTEVVYLSPGWPAGKYLLSIKRRTGPALCVFSLLEGNTIYCTTYMSRGGVLNHHPEYRSVSGISILNKRKKGKYRRRERG